MQGCLLFMRKHAGSVPRLFLAQSFLCHLLSSEAAMSESACRPAVRFCLPTQRSHDHVVRVEVRTNFDNFSLRHLTCPRRMNPRPPYKSGRHPESRGEVGRRSQHKPLTAGPGKLYQRAGGEGQQGPVRAVSVSGSKYCRFRHTHCRPTERCSGGTLVTEPPP